MERKELKCPKCPKSPKLTYETSKTKLKLKFECVECEKKKASWARWTCEKCKHIFQVCVDCAPQYFDKGSVGTMVLSDYKQGKTSKAADEVLGQIDEIPGWAPVSLTVHGLSLTKRLWAGKITSKTYKEELAIRAVTNISAKVCTMVLAALVTALVGPVGGVLSYFIARLIGRCCEKGVRKAAKKIKEKKQNKHDENWQRAELLMEAFMFLEIEEDFVKAHLDQANCEQSAKRFWRSYSEKAKQCHHDSPHVKKLDEEGKEKAKVKWELLDHAYDHLKAFNANKDDKALKDVKAIIRKQYSLSEPRLMTWSRFEQCLNKPTTVPITLSLDNPKPNSISEGLEVEDFKWVAAIEKLDLEPEQFDWNEIV